MKLLHALLTAIVLYIIASLTFISPLRADDSLLQKSWNDLKTNSSFHLLDNLTPGTFYDFKEHVLMAGGTTELYNYRHVSFDVGVVKSIDKSTSVVPASDTLPIVGLKLKVGEWLDTNPALHNLGTSLGLNQGVLQYLTAGVWTARDFVVHENRYGGYTGLQVKFGGSAQ